MHTRISRPRAKSVATLLCVGALLVASAAGASADLTPDPLRIPSGESGQTLERNVLAKAAPDECFYGTEHPVGPINPDGTCPDLDVGTSEAPVMVEGTPKVNQAYVWGLTKESDSLWWGTGPNIHCLVMSGYLQSTATVQTDSYVCEPTRAPYGDFRPAKIYQYDERSDTQTDLTSRIPATSRAAYLATTGIRSAGSLDGVVFFAGPTRAGINMFAFDADDGSFLGHSSFPAYTNIRKWVEVQGELYTGVAKATGGGAVLRWTGSKSSPFVFEEVGVIDGDGAELAEHDGRLYVATWPTGSGESRSVAGLWMSPLIGGDHLLAAADAADWTKVWVASDYEPDDTAARHYGGGALASFDGRLYWGTMHVPGTTSLELETVYGDAVGEDVYLRASRAISIFRGDDFDTDHKSVEVLYGDEAEWAFDGTTWEQKTTGGENGTPTGGGSYGPSGFGNPFNNYTWTMDVFGGQLYVGTMDYSYLALDMLDEPQEPSVTTLTEEEPEVAEGLQDLLDLVGSIRPGADLWRFPDGDTAAAPESRQGVGNYANYGVRTMVSDDAAGALYIGSANPMNLMTDTTDDRPEGGWELIRLTPPDSMRPVSWATAPAVSTSPTWTVGYTAKDEGSGVAKVELFVKAPGAASYVSAAVDTVLDGRFAFDSGGVEGDYAFYTIATDKAGNVEIARDVPDVVTEYVAPGQVVVDETAPWSRATSPRFARHDSLKVRYTAKDEAGGSGLAKVELFVKVPGAASYTKVSVDSGPRIDGVFGYTATAGDGVYRFFTVATDQAGNREPVPAVADSRTVVDRRPAVLKRWMGQGPFVLDLSRHDRLMLRTHVSEQARMTFLVRGERGVVKQYGPRLVRKGLVTRLWSGDAGHHKVRPGRYVLVMRALDKAGNLTTLRTQIRVVR